MLIFCWSAEALAQQVSDENLDIGLIYPPFSKIRKISAHIAASVAAKAYDLGEWVTSVQTIQTSTRDYIWMYVEMF